MPTPKQYRNNAERQAAYRSRHKQMYLTPQRDLAMLARSLHVVFGQAVELDQCRLPKELYADRPEDTLSAIIQWLDPNPDPIRYGLPHTQTKEEHQTNQTNSATARTGQF